MGFNEHLPSIRHDSRLQAWWAIKKNQSLQLSLRDHRPAFAYAILSGSIVGLRVVTYAIPNLAVSFCFVFTFLL